jgi:phosphatidylglycerol lysyltransferase
MKFLAWGGRHFYRFPCVQQLTNYFSTTHRNQVMERFFAECPVPTEPDPYQALEIFWSYNFFKRQYPPIIDLMRRRTEVEQGTMDFLFTSMFQHFKERGYDTFNLGLVALSGVGEKPKSPRLERAMHYLYNHLNQFYNFQGLHAFKEKFKPHWEPRYFIYPSRTALPEVIVALIRADSGDRLLDYFKPGD